jgi:hypothetical protein
MRLLALKAQGVADREDEFADEMAAAQTERNAQLDRDRKAVEDERKARR